MKERLLFVETPSGFKLTPKPLKSFNKVCEVFFREFSKRVVAASPLTKDQFLGAYKGRKRTVYENAFQSLHDTPFKLSDSYISFFTKCEKINFTKKEDPAPRGISPRNPRYHVLLGPYVKRIEHVIYDTIADVFGAKTVFKGLNAVQRGKHLRSHWDSFDEPVAIGLDASRFDQHVSKQALIFEHKFYKRFYPKNKEFKYLLSLQLTNRLYARCPDGTAKLTLDGGRMSGDMNTALGNCLLMSCMVYSYLSSRIDKFRLANDGDDCVVIIEKRNLFKMTELPGFFADLGFTMKVENPVYVFEEIEFCQSQPIWTPEGWIMVRKVPDSIAKDSISVKPLDNPKVFRRWMKAVGLGGLSLTGGVPIVQELYKKYSDIGGDVKPLEGDPTMETGMLMLGKGMKREYCSIHPLTRVSFWRAFGIPISKQLAIESEIKCTELEYKLLSTMDGLAGLHL